MLCEGDAVGNWTLSVHDTATDDDGEIRAFAITLGLIQEADYDSCLATVVAPGTLSFRCDVSV